MVIGLNFIAVMVYENADRAIKNVELGEHECLWFWADNTFENLSKDKTGVECKLNYAMASGEQREAFFKGDIYKTYVEIYNQGLA